ncbi:MAG: alpha/beta fold hydrolase [Ignavibacteriae bacterium]|nr:MAG: alpha/beta fold hydrolase [Ignavibacteriota bacterium]
MQLHYNAYGSESSPALIILHGLFGLSENWHSYGKLFGEQFRTYIPDARNHGRSPHRDVFNYPAMAEDMVEFMMQHHISSASFLGHSMGGKTAALTALLHPELVNRLIVVDIAPRSYQEHHDQVLEAMMSLDLSGFHYRKDIDEALAMKIPEVSVRQFLLKNLMRDDSGLFRWKLNLRAIEKNNEQIYKELPRDHQYVRPALFIRGEKSEYIQMDDLPLIGQLFPAAELVTIKNAGHWVHVDAREEFTEVVLDFLS